MHCLICGDDSYLRTWRFYDPDEGWKIGGLCKWCYQDAIKLKPKIDDYFVGKIADRKGIKEVDALVLVQEEYISEDNIDEFIDAVYG